MEIQKETHDVDFNNELRTFINYILEIDRIIEQKNICLEDTLVSG